MHRKICTLPDVHTLGRTHIHNTYVPADICTLMPMYHTDRHTLTLTPYHNTITAFTLPPPFLPPPAHWAWQDRPVQSQYSWSDVDGVCSGVQSGTHHTSQQREGLRLAWQAHNQDGQKWCTFWSVSTTIEATDEEWQRNSQLACWDPLPFCPNFTPLSSTWMKAAVQTSLEPSGCPK